jgi:hypothetical protein
VQDHEIDEQHACGDHPAQPADRPADREASAASRRGERVRERYGGKRETQPEKYAVLPAIEAEEEGRLKQSEISAR